MTDHAIKPVLLELLRWAQGTQNAFFAQLPAAELAAIGMADYWSAKDHVAHLTFWRQRLALRLRAVLRREPQPDAQAWEELNPIMFEQYRHDPWDTLLAESDQAYAELIELTAELTEEDLVASNRFEWVGSGMPLYTSFMGNCFEHTQAHLAQYLSDRKLGDDALKTYERWASQVVDLDVPALLRGYALYNLACFYVTHDRVEQAREPLRRAFTLYPATREFARTDADLVALRAEMR